VTDRTRARELAAEALARHDPTGWFETLYREAEELGTPIPWAELAPNPYLRAHVRPRSRDRGRAAIVVGCGLGDDAEWLAGAGFATTAFDISASAIRACRRRFPRSAVTYRVADLFRAPAEWRGRFDLVYESYTLQVLPVGPRSRAVGRIARLVAPSGELFVVARGREEKEPPGAMPWPLTRAELLGFRDHGLGLTRFEDSLDHERPPVRRFRATFRRPTAG